MNRYNAEHPEMDEPELSDKLIEEIEAQVEERNDVLGFARAEAIKRGPNGVTIVSTQDQMVHEHRWLPYREGPEGRVDKCECGATRVRPPREPFGG